MTWLGYVSGFLNEFTKIMELQADAGKTARSFLL
jgi:hypothetical protein